MAWHFKASISAVLTYENTADILDCKHIMQLQFIFSSDTSDFSWRQYSSAKK
jgi:hypothetical protein